MVCGVRDHPHSPVSGTGNVLHGVLATRHGAHEAGACALPVSNYAVINPVALGSIGSLQHLKFRPDLCGHVLKVDCGNGPLNIIITNSNYGGGLDLYGSTWGRLTNNKPPGETHCSVRFTDSSAFNFHGPRCFYKPGTDYGNAYYHNVGLLNTGGRIVTGATIDNRAGEHRGDNPYYAFNFGPIDNTGEEDNTNASNTNDVSETSDEENDNDATSDDNASKDDSTGDSKSDDDGTEDDSSDDGSSGDISSEDGDIDDGTADSSKDDGDDEKDNSSDDEENDNGDSQHVEDLYYNPKSRKWKHSDEDN
ncbi:unnamed protein product [Rotaria sp. Silwood1]|nr:unnamed protein product [Rotaria sp. Silwood1]CAF1684975.1 unnamed protein product [Rotaria sp. Silwood1]CAF4691741.1 unnamed protein product [Rotaria sp. Silwood1]